MIFGTRLLAGVVELQAQGLRDSGRVESGVANQSLALGCSGIRGCGDEVDLQFHFVSLDEFGQNLSGKVRVGVVHLMEIFNTARLSRDFSAHPRQRSQAITCLVGSERATD